MASKALLVEDTSISRAWARAYLRSIGKGVPEIRPLVVKVHLSSDDDSDVDASLRRALDSELALRGKSGVHTVANTIFPWKMWEPSMPRGTLYERYTRAYPRIKRKNPYGTYFHRMISYGITARIAQGGGPVNQLEHIISVYREGVHRRTALQVLLFDPLKDHTRQARRGFPCLQHVTFYPTRDSTLRVTGVYALQYVFSKACGNYEGLRRLGMFMAHELGLRLEEVMCIANVAQHDGNETKASLQHFSERIERLVSSDGDKQIFGKR